MKISVVTVCFNAERYIERTIRSVLAQTLDGVEYIIVDGASTDSTMNIVGRYADQIDTVISEPDEGIYDAMNKGIAAATGNFLLFLNADDFFVHPDVLRFARREMGDGNCELYYGDFLVMSSESGKVSIKDQSSEHLFSILVDFPGQPGLLYRRDVFDKVGRFNTAFRVVSDYEWIIAAYLDHDVSRAYLGFPLVIFQEGGVSTDAKFRELHRRERKAVIEKYLSEKHWKLYKRAVAARKQSGIYHRLAYRFRRSRIAFRRGVLVRQP